MRTIETVLSIVARGNASGSRIREATVTALKLLAEDRKPVTTTEDGEDVFFVSVEEQGTGPELADKEIAAGIEELVNILLVHVPYKAGARAMLCDMARSKVSNKSVTVRETFKALVKALDSKIGAGG